MHFATTARFSLLKAIERIIFARQLDESGPHVDPQATAAPSRDCWEGAHRMPWASHEVNVFRECLVRGGETVRDSVLSDLADYHGMSKEECRNLCVMWEAQSLNEWRAGDRSTAEGIADFYDEANSWVFDLMWYAYLQTERFGLASSVMSARFAVGRLGRGDHLDFGSGVGITSHLFHRLGFRTTSADISKPMLEFAGWRARRHGAHFDLINLRSERLPSAAYDVITAIDTLVHIPDFDGAARDLHRALRPGGYLIANFDIRSGQSEATSWHLYQSAIDLDLRLRRVGFAREASLSPVTLCYRRIEAGTMSHRARTVTNHVLAPARRLGATLFRVRWPTPSRLKKLLAGRGRRTL